MSNRLLSIVTVNLNNCNGLQLTFTSISEQSTQPFEVIVIDGGSSDGSLELIMKSTKSGLVTKFVSEKDNGIYDAMNRGIASVTGDFILFLNSGDILNGCNALEEMLKQSETFDADLYYADVIVSESGKMINFDDRIDRKFLFFRSLCHQSIIYKASIFTTVGNYDTTYKIISDREHLYRVYMKGLNFKHIEFPLVQWEQNGFSSRNLDQLALEVSRFHKTYYTPIERFLMKLVRKLEILFSTNGK